MATRRARRSPRPPDPVKGFASFVRDGEHHEKPRKGLIGDGVREARHHEATDWRNTRWNTWPERPGLASGQQRSSLREPRPRARPPAPRCDRRTKWLRRRALPLPQRVARAARRAFKRAAMRFSASAQSTRVAVPSATAWARRPSSSAQACSAPVSGDSSKLRSNLWRARRAHRAAGPKLLVSACRHSLRKDSRFRTTRRGPGHKQADPPTKEAPNSGSSLTRHMHKGGRNGAGEGARFSGGGEAVGRGDADCRRAAEAWERSGRASRRLIGSSGRRCEGSALRRHADSPTARAERMAERGARRSAAWAPPRAARSRSD